MGNGGEDRRPSMEGVGWMGSRGANLVEQEEIRIHVKSTKNWEDFFKLKQHLSDFASFIVLQEREDACREVPYFVKPELKAQVQVLVSEFKRDRRKKLEQSELLFMLKVNRWR